MGLKARQENGTSKKKWKKLERREDRRRRRKEGKVKIAERKEIWKEE